MTTTYFVVLSICLLNVCNTDLSNYFGGNLAREAGLKFRSNLSASLFHRSPQYPGTNWNQKHLFNWNYILFYYPFCWNICYFLVSLQLNQVWNKPFRYSYGFSASLITSLLKFHKDHMQSCFLYWKMHHSTEIWSSISLYFS